MFHPGQNTLKTLIVQSVSGKISCELDTVIAGSSEHTETVYCMVFYACYHIALWDNRSIG